MFQRLSSSSLSSFKLTKGRVIDSDDDDVNFNETANTNYNTNTNYYNRRK